MQSRLLITGATGQVGRAFAGLAADAGYEVLAPSRAELDFLDERSIRDAVTEPALMAVVNCAAYTAVDAAETEPELARAVNEIAPACLASETAKRGIPLVHVSTDYVFNGRKRSAYLEDDPVSPLNVYGRTKAAGERKVRERNERHAIVRTSWVVSACGKNFVKTMVSRAGSRTAITVVNDQIGCPTAASDLAHALLVVLRGGRSGTWHFANRGVASWYDLACFVFNRLAQFGHPVPCVHPIRSCDYPAPALRPLNSRLDTGRFTADFGVRPRRWEVAVREIVDCLCAGPVDMNQ
jgi:dTDP-4-dehydrorhamnose reductase